MYGYQNDDFTIKIMFVVQIDCEADWSFLLFLYR